MALKTNDGIDISKAKVNPRRVFVRIKGEERENVFLGKEITTEQGKKKVITSDVLISAPVGIYQIKYRVGNKSFFRQIIKD